MLSKLVSVVLFAVVALVSTVTAAEDVSENQAYFRILQLASDVNAVSLTLEDGRTVVTNLTPFSVSDYMPYGADRSTFITLTITPQTGQPFVRDWSVPPLSSGHHTVALVGRNADNTLDLIFVAEDDVCEGKLATGSCVIILDNVRGSPSLRFMAANALVGDDVGYRHVVVNHVDAGSYHNLTGVDVNAPQTMVYQLQRGFFEPNVIYLYNLTGNYPGQMFSDYSIGSIRRVSVDTMTFLQGLTANLQLTGDGQTLVATENIVAILQQSGLDKLLANTQLSLTVFAPIDGAILKAIPDLYQCVTSNPEAMKALILNHILVGSYTAAQLVSAGKLTTMAGTPHSFSAANGGFLVDNSVQVSESSRYPTINGNVYLIDTVFVPDGFARQYCEQG
jgi:uncharacterized surface protein with fasciclin (FAS1) repeats